VITSLYGEEVLRGLLDRHGFGKVRVLAVPNEFFGGNVAVTGLLTGEDISRVLAKQSPAGRYLLPDVCLSAGRFLDGSAVADLPVAVEIVPSDGAFLRAVLEEVK
jgi:NifB/MoaA-like Fe-S oxidoreductase